MNATRRGAVKPSFSLARCRTCRGLGEILRQDRSSGPWHMRRGRIRQGRARVVIRAAILLLVLLSGPAREIQAQTPSPPPARPPGGFVAPLIAPPTQRVLPQEQPEIVPPTAPTVEAPEAPPPGPPVRVDRVQVEGVTVYDEAALRGLYGDVVGAAVPRARLDEVVQALQTRYREDGYILTLVRGEFQKTSEGQVIFVIRATEGYIS